MDALNPWNWSDHTLDVLTAIGTAGAVVATLVLAFGIGTWRKIRAWRTRPRLRLTFDESSNINAERISFDSGATVQDAAYVRLAIQNRTGRRAAHGVEVLVTRIETDWLIGGNDRDLWSRINLGPLPWTHSESPELTIGPGAMRTVDLGYIVDSDDRRSFTIPMLTAPLSGVQHLAPGSYEISLSLVAHNIDAETYRMTLSWDGGWFDDRPISEHLTVGAPRKV